MPLLQGRPSPSLRTRTCTFQRIRLAIYVFLGMFSIRERSCVELMVTVSTEDECLSVASGHHLLPQSFSFGDIFQLPYVMDLERSLRGFAVFTLFPGQPSDDFGPAKRPDVDVGLFVDHGVVRQGWFEVLEPEEFDDARLLFSWDEEYISLVGFQPLRDLVDAGLVLVCERFQQAHPPHLAEFMQHRFRIFRKGVVVRQASEFPVVGKNDFSITALGPFLLVDSFGGLVIAIAFGSTELLELVRGNMQLYPLGDRFHRDVSGAPFHLNGPIS